MTYLSLSEAFQSFDSVSVIVVLYHVDILDGGIRFQAPDVSISGEVGL